MTTAARTAAIGIALTMSVACGGAIEEQDEATPTGNAPAPLAVYTANAERCGALGASTNASPLRTGEGDAIAVVEVVLADECTGLGGQYVLAREIGGARHFWIGGHGCRTLGNITSSSIRYGVLRYRAGETKRIPGSVCVAFPDENARRELTSDAHVEAIATFASRADAESYARSLRSR